MSNRPVQQMPQGEYIQLQSGQPTPVPPQTQAGFSQQQQDHFYPAPSPAPAPTPLPPPSVSPPHIGGVFDGVGYLISRRHTNSTLTLQLTGQDVLTARPGTMIAMSPSLTCTGHTSFSFKKLFFGGSLTESRFSGEGELILAPPMLGDIDILVLPGNVEWTVGKDAFLACSDQRRLKKNYVRQGIGKAFFSGEGLFVYKISGIGVVFIQSFGAIVKKDLAHDEQYIVDNGHLVAWSCSYKMVAVTAGVVSSVSAGEGWACKFTGPGTVYLQTRNPREFAQWMKKAGR